MTENNGGLSLLKFMGRLGLIIYLSPLVIGDCYRNIAPRDYHRPSEVKIQNLYGDERPEIIIDEGRETYIYTQNEKGNLVEIEKLLESEKEEKISKIEKIVGER